MPSFCSPLSLVLKCVLMVGKPGTVDRLRYGWARASGWGWLYVGIGAALFALRVSLEATPPNLAWGIGAAAICLFGAWVNRITVRLYLEPLALLWIYVIWPTAWPEMALGVGFVGAMGVLVHDFPLRGRAERTLPSSVDRFLLWDGLVFAGALALYLSTLAPDLLPADSGEFQIVGPLLGVAHPPGYPLFTLLAKGFALIPLGTVPWRLNAMGAVTGALTLVVVARTARRVSTCIRRGALPAADAWSGIAAAGALGLSTTFWAQSTTINIRMLSTLFVALCIATLVRFLLAPVASSESVRAITGLAASFGLAIAHTAWPAFFAPVFGLAILWRDPAFIRRPRYWPRYLAAFALPFLGHLYIVIRAITGAPFGTEELVHAGRVIDHLLGRGFGGDMFAFLRLDRLLWERTLVIGNILHFQFGIPLLIIALAGLLWLARKRAPVAFLLGGVLATMAFIVATYRAPQSVEYLMPAYLPIALSIGAAVALAVPLGQRSGSAGELQTASTVQSHAQLPNSLLAAVLLLPIVFLGRAHLPSYWALHQDRSTRAYAESVLLHAPPNAHILSNWHWYTPLRYLQLVEEQRPDVLVTYVYPQGATAMPQAWPQRIDHELRISERPLIVTNFYPTYGSLPYRFQPLGEAFRVRPGPSWEPPDHLEPIEADLHIDGRAIIHLIGYRVYHEGALHPGDEVTVDLVWQPLAHLERPYAFFVHLVGADGTPLGQRDIRHDRALDYEPGEVLIDRYRFPVYLDAAPGTYTLIAGAYLPFDDGSWKRLITQQGQDTLRLAEIAVAPSETPPVTLHPMSAAFRAADSSGPTLMGVDYDDTLPDQRRVYLHWQAGDSPALAQLYADETLISQEEVPAWSSLDPYAHRDARSTEDARTTRAKRYLTTALDVPSGTRGLRIVLRQGTEPLPARGAWGIPRATSQPLPDPGSGTPRYVAFGGKLALIGVRTGGWTTRDHGRIALCFLALRPIVRDYIISVGVLGSAVTDAPSDGVPAIGAIPTFKWIRSSLVNDVHLIYVQGGGEAELTLGVYDAFTTTALPPLDERIARQGRAGVHLEWVSIP
jgi:hypothetical protein